MQVQFEKIPPFLKSYDQFCNWKYELRKGEQKKVPYTPGTARRACVNDPATFEAFDAAASATGFDGIGIRVSGRLVGIDLDHCIENGKLLPWAQPIVDRFRDTYIEISPSGTGLRIFCLLPGDFSYDTQTYYIKHGDIEVYIPGHTNRFLTVTGNALTKADVVETAEALVWLLDTYMRRPTPPTPSAAVPGTSYLSDDSVIVKASEAKNGEKFRRLWSGDITGYPSHSEADVALASMLAFWCGGDAEQIDRLFRQSGLMREKWDELRGADTYGNLTIAKAISGMTDSYKPVVSATAAEDFGMERLEELDPMDTAKYPWNDIGAGHIFADFYQDRLRFVPERKVWFYYEDGIWKPDTGSLRAMKDCMELANLIYAFALKIHDEDKRTVYMKYASRWHSHNNRVNILKDAQVYHPMKRSRRGWRAGWQN